MGWVPKVFDIFSPGDNQKIQELSTIDYFINSPFFSHHILTGTFPSHSLIRNWLLSLKCEYECKKFWRSTFALRGGNWGGILEPRWRAHAILRATCNYFWFQKVHYFFCRLFTVCSTAENKREENIKFGMNETWRKKTFVWQKHDTNDTAGEICPSNKCPFDPIRSTVVSGHPD